MSRSQQRLCLLCESPAADDAVQVNAQDLEKLSAWLRQKLDAEFEIAFGAEAVICQNCMCKARMDHENLDGANCGNDTESDCWMGHDIDSYYQHQQRFYKDLIKKKTDDDIKDKEKVIHKQEEQILKLENKKKVLQQTIKKHEKKIELFEVQQNKEKPMPKQGALKSAAKAEPRVARYLSALEEINKRVSKGEGAQMLLVQPELMPDMENTISCLGVTVHASTVYKIARRNNSYTSFVYAMCSVVFDKSAAVYFSFDGSTRSILHTLALPQKLANGFTKVVAEVGRDYGLILPKQSIPAKTSTQAVQQRRAIAKKTLNTWLSKLRRKYRPNRKADNLTKKPVDDTNESTEEIETDPKELDESTESE